MPHWVLKAATQAAISCLPGSHSWNYLFQKKLIPRPHFEVRLHHARTHLEHYATASGRSEPPPTVIELGTGWDPVLPVAFFLCGVSRVITMDRHPWLRPAHVAGLLGRFLEYHREGRLSSFLPCLQPERIPILESAAARPDPRHVDDLLAPLNIQYMVVDARHSGLPDGCGDLLLSNLTLGCVPADVLVGIMKEFRRLAALGAVMVHYIDLTDCYANFDPHITGYNYLRFSSRTWRLFNNRIHHQNRLRVSDYRDLHAATGFRIVGEDNHPGWPEKLAQIRIAREFERYSPADLAVATTWMISRPA